MEQPLFYRGQKVVYIGDTKTRQFPFITQLIEGKAYYVSDPNKDDDKQGIWITLAGIPETHLYLQRVFVPYETDLKLDNEIHEALKGQKIIV